MMSLSRSTLQQRRFGAAAVRALVAAALVIFGFAANAAQFGPSQYPIKDLDGQDVGNFTLSPELSERLMKLPGLVPAGNLKGDVTLMQFYDLNCPYCRAASRDVDMLIHGDLKLKLIFVPYPVLSVESIQGGRVEIAAARMMAPDRFLELHRRIYAQRGVIDANKVFAAAISLGLDRDKLAAAANEHDTIDVLKTNADFGSVAKLNVTPAYVVNGVAILGHPGLKALQGVIRSVRGCGKVAC